MYCRSNSWAFLIKLRIIVFFLLKLRLLYSINSLMKMFENIVFWLKLVKVFLYDMKLFAVNLIFNQVVACNNKIWIKLLTSESVFLILQLYCSSVSSTAIASLLIRVDIKSLICQNVNLFSTEIRFKSLFYVNINQNCLKLDL